MPIPGTTTIAHVRENLDAQDIQLSREDIQSINNIAETTESICPRKSGEPMARLR